MVKPSDQHQHETFFEHAKHVEQDIEKKVVTVQQNAVQKFPFLFLGLSTFGGVAVFYGFEKINSPESENVFIKKHPALKSYLLILSELVKQRHFIIFIS